MQFLPFSAQTRMSGVDVDGLHIRKGAADVIIGDVEKNGNRVPRELNDADRSDCPHRGNASRCIPE